MNNKKLGRNEPCHCGSGLKFKKCCIDKPFVGSPELEEDLKLGERLVKEFDAKNRSQKIQFIDDLTVSDRETLKSHLLPVAGEKVESVIDHAVNQKDVVLIDGGMMNPSVTQEEANAIKSIYDVMGYPPTFEDKNGVLVSPKD